MRLIDADALKQPTGSYNPIKYTYEYGDVITVADIDTAPTIEAKRIVLAKQCGVCDNTDGNVYTSIPPKVRCKITGQFHGYADLCTVETAPVKHGKWSHYYDDELVSGTCSVCGWQSIIMETDVADMPYCPNCGAKMDADVADIPYSPNCRALIDEE